jgi:hypothetical protein
VPRDELPRLPPESRTVGQLVAESIRLYGNRFFPSLALGLSVAVLNQATGISRLAWLALLMTAGGMLLTLSYVGATVIVSPERPPLRAVLTGIAVGYVVVIPLPVLLLAFVLPGVAWLALFGLAVPAAVIERLGFLPAIRRGFRLALADFVHALGSLATLVILYFVTRVMLTLLLRDQSDQTERVAAFLADVVIAPVLFLGGALLYFDQEARDRLRHADAAEAPAQ